MLAVWSLWQRQSAAGAAVLSASVGAAGRHGAAVREVRFVQEVCGMSEKFDFVKITRIERDMAERLGAQSKEG